MFQMTKMNPNWLIGIMSATTTYNRRTTNPDPVLLIRAMIAMITTRNSGNATTTVTKDSASIPSVSIFFRISRRSSFSNCSAFTRKYGLSWPPLVDVVTTPCRKSENLEDGERWAAFRIAVRMSRPSSSVSRVIHSASSPGRNRFVFVSVPRVSSFSNVELPNGLASCLDGLHDCMVLPAHFFPDSLRGLLGVLVVLDNESRDLSEVQHALLQHVVDNVDAALELRLHLLVGHVLHFHDLVEQERVPLVHEGVRGGVPLVDRVRDEFVRLRLKPDELDDLLHPSHDRVSDPGVGLDDDEVQGGQQDARGVDWRVLQAVHHRLDGVRVHRGHRRVARRHRLEHRVRLLAADLSDDDVVRPLPQRRSNEVVHVDLAAGLAVGTALAHAGPRRPRDPVLVGEVDLPGVLDGHDLRSRSDEEGGAVQGRGLSAGRPTADHHRLAALHRDPEIRDHLGARGPELDEFDRGEGLLLVPPDRDRRASGCDFLAVLRWDTLPFQRGAVQDRVRDGDLLAASLPEHDGE